MMGVNALRDGEKWSDRFAFLIDQSSERLDFDCKEGTKGRGKNGGLALIVWTTDGAA